MCRIVLGYSEREASFNLPHPSLNAVNQFVTAFLVDAGAWPKRMIALDLWNPDAPLLINSALLAYLTVETCEAERKYISGVSGLEEVKKP